MGFFAKGSTSGLQYLDVTITPESLTEDEQSVYQAVIAHTYESERDAVIARLGNRTILSLNTLKDINEIRYPTDTRFYGAPQGRFSFGKYFEDRLFGEETTHVPTGIELEVCEKMLTSCRNHTHLRDWIGAPKLETQITHTGVYKGYKIMGIADAQICAEPDFREGCDIKTTSRGGLVGFLTDCQKFYYFAQAKLYSHLANYDTFTIFAIGKKNYKVIHIEMSEAQFAEGEKQLDALIANLEYYKVANRFRA